MFTLPTVVLVDDDPTTNFINQRLLQRMQVCAEVLIARNGLEALTLLLARWHKKSVLSPVLLLLDMHMPVMSGYEFLALYARLPETHRAALLVVTLTAAPLDQELLRAQQLPITDFLHKPLTPESMTRLLQRHYGYEAPAA